MKHPYASYLFLMRHAEAKNAENGQDDFARHLSQTGLLQAQWIGEKLKEKQISIQNIVCSPAQRTKETLHCLDIPPAITIQYPQNLYHGSARDYLSIIHKQNAKSLLLIAHNPTISELLHHLIHGNMQNTPTFFPTAGFAVIGFVTPLKSILEKSGDLLAFYKPQ